MNTTLRRSRAARGIVAGALGLSMLTLAGCGGSASAANEKPAKLKLGIPPGEADPATMEQAKLIGKELEDATGVPVEVVQTSDYLAIVEAMRSKLIDVALFSPMPTVLAKNEANTKTLAVALGAPYRTDIICSPKAGVTDLKQIQDHSMAFVDPGSTSGNFIPKLMLKQAGVNVDTMETTYAGGHDTAAISVKQGSTDCAAVASLLMPKLEESGTLKKSDYTLVAESDEIPISITVIARDGLSPEITDRISADLINNQSPAVLKIAGAKELVAPEDADWAMFYDAADELGVDLKDVE